MTTHTMERTGQRGEERSPNDYWAKDGKYLSDGPARWILEPEVDYVGIDPDRDSPELRTYVTDGRLLEDMKRAESPEESEPGAGTKPGT